MIYVRKFDFLVEKEGFGGSVTWLYPVGMALVFVCLFVIRF